MHDSFSLLDGIANTDAMVKKAKENGCSYIAQTNHGNVAGHLDLLIAAKKYGIKPICGMETYHWDPEYHSDRKKAFHLTLNAATTEGLHNLWEISSDIYRDTGEGHRKPFGEWKHFEGHGAGILCSSACLGGAISQAAKQEDEEMALRYATRYAEIFDDFFIELHTNQQPEQMKVNRWLAEFADKHGFKTIYATDSHFVEKEDFQIHQAWLGIQTGLTYAQRNDPKAMASQPEEYVQSEKDVRGYLSYLGNDIVEKAFDGVDEYVSHVETYNIDDERKIPRAKMVPDGMDSGDYLRMACERGLCERVLGMKFVRANADGTAVYNKKTYNGVNPKPYIDRLNKEEFPLIINYGLSDFFLITMDYIGASKKMMLVGPGRGSAAGSLVCYLLGITEIDPIKRNLMFGRFLNLGRVRSMPDIDVDFARDTRVKAEDYLVETYGADHVAKVGTVLSLKMKGALAKSGRYYDVPYAEILKINKLVDMIPDMIQKEVKEWSWDEIWDTAPKMFLDQIAYYMEQYPSMFTMARKIYRLISGKGEHAAGYIVSPTPLASILPTWRNPKNEKIVMQFNMRAVDRYGFLKIDVLGLRTLQTLQETNDFIEQRHGHKIDFYSLDATNESETAVWDMLCSGDTMGVFQMESQQVVDICTSMRPRSVDDLAVIVALDRPGVLDAGMLDVYLSRRNGAYFEYDFPECEKVLGSTYGVCIFQEESMELCKVLAGYDDVGADHMRSIIGHKKLKEMDAEESKFLSGCVANGFDEEKSRGIFEQIKASGNYSFNRSHAYAYALVAYWCAYVKVHYMTEYLTACLNTDNKKNNSGEDPTLKYISRCRAEGISIVAPNVNLSKRAYTINSDKEIQMGFESIAGVGEKAADDIVAGQPYSSFESFMYQKVAARDVAISLSRAGAFDTFLKNRYDFVNRIEEADYPVPDKISENQMQLIPFNPDNYVRKTDVVPEYSDEFIIRYESELFGIPITIDPYRHYREKLGTIYWNIMHADDLADANAGSANVIMARILNIKRHETKKGGQMAFVKFECDDYSVLEATVFSEVFVKKSDAFVEGCYIIAEVVKQLYHGNDSYIVNDIRVL